jgi:hypothetical protein
LAEAAWSTGASGIACEAVIAASPRPKPKMETASNFMILPFFQRFAFFQKFAAMRQFRNYAG